MSVGTGLAVVALAVAGAGGGRGLGSTAAEREADLPGDELVPGAGLVRTHAIDVPAPPEGVWPWIAQLGQEHGGFYTYTWVENLVGCDMTNADAIVEDWQHPGVGDVVRLHPDIGLRIAHLQVGHALVLSGEGAVDRTGAALDDTGYDFSWAFALRPTPGGGTRLLTRERYRPRTARAAVLVRAGALMSTVMTWGMLRGIRRRAAHASRATSATHEATTAAASQAEHVSAGVEGADPATR